MKSTAISFLGALSLVLSMPAFSQNSPNKAASRGKTGVEREVEFMKARNEITDAELAP
ncbi:MAG TPA: hypothetical protein VKJ01_16335 [Candidatus Solibacter sp.]|nr:hypothetical protein [Candidatus Solibacter sp.]